MDEFKEGDLVEAVKGEVSLRGRLINTLTGGVLGIATISDRPDEATFLRWLKDNGFTVSLVERAKPELPTEPGIYRDMERDVWMLTASGEWISLSARDKRSDYGYSDVEIYAPLIRLEPVADTARKVLERVLDVYKNGVPQQFVSSILPLVAEEFGVTE